jgi:hypothetical protein
VPLLRRNIIAQLLLRSADEVLIEPTAVDGAVWVNTMVPADGSPYQRRNSGALRERR